MLSSKRSTHLYAYITDMLSFYANYLEILCAHVLLSQHLGSLVIPGGFGSFSIPIDCRASVNASPNHTNFEPRTLQTLAVLIQMQSNGYNIDIYKVGILCFQALNNSGNTHIFIVPMFSYAFLTALPFQSTSVPWH
jgi:hypothetical protein